MNRNFITKNEITLYGISEKGNYPRKFKIKEGIDKGGSVLSYKAEYTGSGVLKEFFPAGLTSLSRGNDGNIICGDDDREEYEKLLDAYIRPYSVMSAIRCDPDIAGFIPPFEVYYGNEDGSGSVYIWNPQPKLDTFQSFCNDVHKNPDTEPEYKLVKILRSVESLTECIGILHSKKLVHRDIKPSNFGFAKRGGKILDDSISLFDIDSIMYIYDRRQKMISEGFTAPEIMGNEGEIYDFRADIYSIGASLYYAVTGEIFLRKEQFRDIRRAVDNSELITASPSNAYPQLKEIIVKILQRTLCAKERRYESCNELLEDIRSAVYYILPAEATKKISGKEWRLVLVKDYLDKNIMSSAIRQNLYEHPLYKLNPPDKKSINLLIIGLGLYGSKYLDAALQTAQIPGKRLKVTVISANDTDMEMYLNNRPELENFFNINGSDANDPGSYGDIEFKKYLSGKENTGIELMKKKPDHVFVSVGNDIDNYDIAQSIKKQLPCFVSYACEKKSPKTIRSSKNIFPVYVREKDSGAFGRELERIGFNTHLIWNENLNINFTDKKKEYKKVYNHESNLSFAVSLKYKFYSLGIDIDECGESDALEKYIDKISDDKIKEELVCSEHKRWVTEKICIGYKSITDLNDCANGKAKDEKHKRHGCIVRSRAESMLSKGVWRNADGTPRANIWNNPPENEFKKLDPLEKMSVRLHQVYRKHAEKVSAENLLGGNIVTEIREKTESDVSAVSAFQDLITCMKDISNDENGRTGQHLLYEGYKKQFLNAVKDSQLEKREKKTLEGLAGSLSEEFYPVYASRIFHDYKQEDVKIIEKIPFIMSYTEDICLVIPWTLWQNGDNNKLFSNLAAPVALNPGKVIYAAYCESYDDIEDIKSAVPYIGNFMKRKQLRCGIEFIIGISRYSGTGKEAGTENDLKNLSGGRIKRVKVMETEEIEDFTAYLSEYLIKRSKGKKNFFIEKKNSLSIDYSKFKSYRFDCKLMQFRSYNNCRIAEYLNTMPYITVNDIFSLSKAVSTTSNKPEFHNCGDLWKQYKSGTREWKFICGLLKEYSEQNDVIAVFRKKKTESKKKISYLIPFVCKSSVKKIMDNLSSAGIIGKESGIARYNADMCIVSIEDMCGCERKYTELFSNPHLLMNQDYVYCNLNDKDNVVRVFFNDLCVREMECGKLYPKGYAIFDFLSKNKYIINYSKNGSKVSFAYASSKVKELMTMEGRILEVYVYYKLSLAGFSDVRCGFEVNWENNIAKNEFDLILTSGFNSVFIECKATNQLDRGYYDKLALLIRQFGINSTGVIIADCQDAEENERLKSYGRQIKGNRIITVTERKDIEDIANILKKIIKGEYEVV